MANQDRPKGAEPVGVPLRSRKYKAGATIQPGDFVHMEADGLVDPAAAAEAICGVALTQAASGEQVNVADDPDQLFVVQASATEIAAQTNINANYDILATAGNTTFGISRMELDSTSAGTTSTLQLKLVDIDDRPDNAFGANVDCIVQINNHQNKGGTGTAGL